MEMTELEPGRIFVLYLYIICCEPMFFSEGEEQGVESS